MSLVAVKAAKDIGNTFGLATNWACDQVETHPRICIDIGAGHTLFFSLLLEKVFSGNIYSLDPAISPEKNRFNLSLTDFFLTEPDVASQYFDYVFCISVLEHTKNKPEFCKTLDKFNGDLIMTFELSWRPTERYVTRQEMYKCFNMFENHYISKLEISPILADNSDGSWIPCGVVLKRSHEKT